MQKTFLLVAGLFGTISFSASSATAAQAELVTPELKAELITDVRTISPGQKFRVGIRLSPVPGWHTYWRNPGDSGKPTTVKWQAAEGLTVGPLQWPLPERFTLAEFISFGYGSETILMAEAQAMPTLSGGAPATIEASVQWIVCKEVCIPGRAELKVDLPTRSASSAGAPLDYDPLRKRQFDQVQRRIPPRLTESIARPDQPKKVSARWEKEGLWIEGEGAAYSPANVNFLPFQSTWLSARAWPKTRGKAQWQGKQFQIQFAREDLTPEGSAVRSGLLEGLIVFEKGSRAGTSAAYEISIPVSAPVVEPTSGPPPTPERPAWIWFWAYLGGLILNAMPCVFPVLALKVLGYLRSMREARGRPWAQVSWFSAGVVLSFWSITLAIWGLRTLGEQVGWGFQLQSPVFVALLAFLFFVMGLNLLGMFEMGLGLGTLTLKFGSNHHPNLESFISGVVAVIVAAPCTGPYMGSAVGFALAQDSIGMALTIFTALALGLVTPYWLVLFFPRVMEKIIPKPGIWMVRLKEILAFPLFLTAIWLLWVLGQQGGINAVAGALIGFTLAGLSVWVARTSFKGDVFFAGALFLLAVGVTAGAARVSPPSIELSEGLRWEDFQEETFRIARSRGEFLFVDFTAAWCLTCQVNEKVVFSNARVIEKIRDRKVRLIRADWTHRDASITRALESLGRTGVPLGVFYPPGGLEPQLLPNLWTPKLFMEALDQAAGQVTDSVINGQPDVRPASKKNE